MMKTQLWPVLMGLCLSLATAADDDMLRVGNEIKAAPRGLEWPGLIFLLDNVALQDGVLFAFTAYFRTLNKVHLQIWRPVDESKDEYRLVGDWPTVPAVVDGREDIYIHNVPGAKCIRVQSKDRLGIYSPEVPGSVAYTFDASSPHALRYEVTNQTEAPKAGDMLHFDRLAYPYRFSAAAYIHTDLTAYTDPNNPDCPTSLTLPSITGTPAPTPESGATGARGEQGYTGATGPAGQNGATGATGPVGSLGFTGSTGPVGAPGPHGATGPMGTDGAVGATGAAGTEGKVGATGPRGEKGDRGERGPAGGSVQNASYESLYEGCTWCVRIMSPYMMLAALIWLAVVTLLLIITIVYTCCKRRSDAQYRRNIQGYDNKMWPDDKNKDSTYAYIEEGRTAF